MKKNKVKPMPLQDEGKIRVLVFNKKRFVIGLTWENIRAQRNPMKDIRRIGKEKGLDLVAVRHSDSIQAGFAPKTRLKLRGAFSLTVALASLLEGCCIAVVALGENAEGIAQYTLVGKTERGGIHPWSDSIYTAEDMRQKIIDLRDELRGSKGTLDVPVYGDASISWVTKPLDFEAVLEPKNLNKSFRLTPLTWGLTRGQLMTVSAGIIIGLIGLMIYLHFEGEREAAVRAALQRQMARQEEINKQARYKAVLDSFKHPWTEQPSVGTFIDSCQKALNKVPISIEGWMTTALVCTDTSVNVQSIRRTNSAATTEKYVAAVQRLFSVIPLFNFQDSSQTSFSLVQTLPPEGDDPLIPAGERLMHLISRFQALNIDLSVSSVPIKDKLKNSEGEDLPLQEWQEYQFSAETDVPPRDIFKGAAFMGIRLSQITVAANTSDGSLRYKISGSLYGKR